jgi:hypothetical protein
MKVSGRFGDIDNVSEDTQRHSRCLRVQISYIESFGDGRIDISYFRNYHSQLTSSENDVAIMGGT